MGRLNGSQREASAEKTGATAGRRSGLGIVIVVGIVGMAVIAGIILAATGYSLVSSKAVSLETVTSSTVTTSSTSTSLQVSTTSTTPSTDTTTTLEPTPEYVPTTSSTTSSTLGKEGIAFCMRNRIDTIYLSDNRPSISLRQYFGDYEGIFPIVNCNESREQKASCDADLNDTYIANDKLYLGSKVYKFLGYPAVVLTKDQTAYIILSSAEFDKLLNCGSLKTP